MILSEIEKSLLVFNEQDSMELDKLMEGKRIMKEYNEESKEASKKEEIIGLYDKELYDEMIEYHRIRHAKEEGIAEGEKKGVKETSQNIAREMLEKGIDITIISECTGLTKEEIEQL